MLLTIMFNPKRYLSLILLFLHCNTLNSFATPCEDLKLALRQASAISGLTIKTFPKCLEVDEKSYRALPRPIATEKVQQARYEEILFKILGLIPVDYDYIRCMNDEATSEVQAAYFPNLKAVVIPKWREVSFQTLVHEATHVLQDQYWDIGKLKKKKSLTSDQSLALLALVEGDAVVVEDQVKDTDKNQAKNEVATNEAHCTLPATLDAILGFPYDFGPIFIEKLKAARGIQALNKAFLHPPRSTEEIFYIPKYLAHQPEFKIPAPLPIPSWINGGKLKLHLSDTLGEFIIRTWLKRWLSSESAILAAKGWGGDKIALYEIQPQQNYLISWSTLWDSEKDAKEFFEALIQLIKVRFGVVVSKDSPRMLFSLPGVNLQISIKLSLKNVTLEALQGLD